MQGSFFPKWGILYKVDTYYNETEYVSNCKTNIPYNKQWTINHTISIQMGSQMHMT